MAESKKVKVFNIPVEWAVYSSVKVRAENLEEAIRWFKDNKDLIPLSHNPNYIDGSYKMDGEEECDSIEDLAKRTREYWGLNEGFETEIDENIVSLDSSIYDGRIDIV